MSYIHPRKYRATRNRPERTVYYVRFKNPITGRWTERRAGERRKDAEALKRRIDEEIAKGTFGKEKKDPSFSEFASQYLEDKKAELKPSTYKDYRQVLGNHILPFFKRTHLSQVTPARVQDFLRHLQKKGVSPATTGKVYRVLKSLLRRAIALEYLDRDPTIGIRPPRVERKEMDFLERDEVEALLEASEGDIHDIIALAVFTGMRQGEILALRWQDIDYRNGIIRVVRSFSPANGFSDLKSEKSRRAVPLIPRLADIFQKRYESMGRPDPDSLVFPTEAGTPKDRNNLISREFEPALLSAGIRKIRFHDLRHTYASLAIASGADPKGLQSVLGYSSITVTMDTYGHLFPGHMESITRGLDGMFPVSNKESKVVSLPRRRDGGEE
ncbi:site-specific integrase [Candidatus Solincola tengchongensis]|uniref:tyrosine-type recombinase/integrase n=1 Tax=Candidatus Solincola tengchongensis TaxID=2900693 RepID=UPI00258046A4|nr:site-specific integrase [Candidatus Solincola tengchongensis]